MAMKRWNVPRANPRQAKLLAGECGISEFAASILVNRGMNTPALAAALLSDELAFESPFAIQDMERAAERVKQAVDSGESIAIYGDYDCDGVTSTAILYAYLSSLGADVQYYIPKRDGEGYGMNAQAVEKLAEAGVSLLITVDNGISALEEVRLANQLGMTVIVTDHHQVGDELPPAYAVVNPHRKDCGSSFKQLAGVGVAFKLITAMEDGDYRYTLEQFGDVVAVGTIADVVPLVGENRALVRYGLHQLAVTDNLGLHAIMEVAGLHPEKLTSQNVAFGIAPRINAAGRMGDASLAVNLLLADTEEEARTLAEEMNRLNNQRKELEEQILFDIEEQIRQNPQRLNDRVLTFYKEGWHHGIIGIASSKILEQYGKPNLLMALDDGELVGSARSVEAFSLYKALTACSRQLIRYGGHKQAAGFTLAESDFPAFKESLERYVAEHFQVMPGFSYDVDKEILPDELSVENIKSVQVLEPFGADNQQPLYLMRGAVIEGIVPVSENKHVRLKLRFGRLSMTAMCFRTSAERFPYRVGDTIDFLGNVTVNLYNGREYLSVVVKDIHLQGLVQEKFFNAKTYYEMFRRGEPLSQAVLKKMTPAREETAVVYKYLKKHGGFDGEVDLLFNAFLPGGMNYCKYRLILDVLSEVRLIAVSPLLDRVTLCTCEGKVDLEQAATMRTLRQRAKRM